MYSVSGVVCCQCFRINASSQTLFSHRNMVIAELLHQVQCVKHLLLYISDIHACVARLESNIACKSCSTLDFFNILNDLKHSAERTWVDLPLWNLLPLKTHLVHFMPAVKTPLNFFQRQLLGWMVRHYNQHKVRKLSAVPAVQRPKRSELETYRSRHAQAGNDRKSYYYPLFLFARLPVSLCFSFFPAALKKCQRSSFKAVLLRLCLISLGPFIHSFSTYLLPDNTRESIKYNPGIVYYHHLFLPYHTNVPLLQFPSLG